MSSYQRRRRAYPYEKRSRGSIAPFLVLFLAVAGAVALALSPIGTRIKDWAVERVQELGAEASSSPAAVETMADTTADPSASPTETPAVKDVLTVTAQPFFILQMGSYDAESDALLVSNELQSMGGGGYVYENNGAYRLFAAAYTDANSLQSVQAQIRRDGFVSEAYITEAKVLHISVEGAEEGVALFRRLVSVLERVPNAMSELTLRYDKGEADKQEVRNELASLLQEIEKALEEWQVVDSNDSDGIEKTLREYQKSISTYLIGYDTITEDFYAGSLKHLQLETILAYTKFFEGTDLNG